MHGFYFQGKRQLVPVLWSRDHGLETRVHSSSFSPGLGLGLEIWWPRSRSWSQDSMFGAYACSTITVICSTFKRVLCHQLELMQPVMWFRDHGLETWVHSSSFCPGLCLETVKRSWQQHWLDLLLKTSGDWNETFSIWILNGVFHIKFSI